MNATPRHEPSSPRRALRQRLLALAVGLLSTVPAAANIPIPDVPLQAGATVPPNIWFILDDSGSMDWTCMPGNTSACNEIPDVSGHNIKLQTYVRNTIYYNPYLSYQPWRTATGDLMPNTPYTAVYTSTELASGDTTNLASADQVYYVPISATANTSAASGYYRFRLRSDANGGLIERCEWRTGTTWDRNCTNLSSVTWGDITRTVAQERQNFATWYSFHRTRMKVAKAGSSDAFADLPEDVRVGFTTIWNRNTLRIPVGTDAGRFAGTNRAAWFNRLAAAEASNGTPLRSALANAATYFSETGADGPWGPGTGSQQLACRQNFAILTTDGYWNSDAGWNTVNVDGMPGPTITGPNGESFTYTPAPPYSDAVGGTLADQAMRNWMTDLRPDLPNNVPYSPANPAFWQHLVTFGISIGLQGSLNPETDLPALKAGTLAWPNPMPAEDRTRIDDLWHASINGRGEFVSAGDPKAFRDGLNAALSTIVSRTLSNSNVATNSTSFNSGTQIFQAGFVSGQWSGELSAFPLSASGVSPTPVWKASAGIPAAGLRRIFTWNGSTGVAFPTAAQSATLTSPVVDYLKGVRSNEIQFGGTLRDRVHLLGDIINSSPIHDPATNTVFVGANDGMLHAFSGTNGVEQFAYVPAGLNFTNLKTFADKDYKHRFFVDGQVVVSSRRQTPNQTIVVGALGRGGRGVFALDATSPSTFGASNVLWDKTGAAAEPNMGLVLGRPVIARLNNGTLGLIVPNGVNSTNNRAVLFIYNLMTGALIAQIDTGVGSATQPNGLSSPAVFDAGGDGTVDFVFAGDMRGNMWRFDLTSTNPSQWSNAANRSVLFAAGPSKPITAAPSLALNPADFKLWVFFGTGRYLSAGDPGDLSVQSWYGMRDSATTIPLTDLQRRKIEEQTTHSGRLVRTFENAGPLSDGKMGWFIDLVRPPYPPGVAEGERMITNQRVVGRILIASSIIPSNDPCAVGGTGFVNAIDAFTGASLAGSFFDVDGDGSFADETINGRPVGSLDLNISMPTEAALVESILVVGGSRSTTGEVPVDLSSLYGRISWREIVRD
ncbi:pilus assembly protein [Silanimonas lenta]|uniref:pilus assembly protein n=1 Tax=Silanimonas lenta TaxID=265429 RepID=UPI002FE0FC98